MTPGAAAVYPSRDVAPPIFLDAHSTTPVDPRVLDAMLPYFTQKFGNAASRTHAFGWEASAAVEHARETLGAFLGAEPREIVFTSGATESNNLAIRGAVHAARGRSPHVVTTAIEHHAVLDVCRSLEREGCGLTVVPVEANGVVSVQKILAAITKQTVLVSVMLANNEVGTVQPILELGSLLRERGVLLHTDAAQAVGRVAIDVKGMNVDLLSVSAHKIYGPKGVGALYVRSKPRVELAAQMEGGGHERGLRPGTLDVPGIVGLGAAIEILRAEGRQENERVRALRDRLEGALFAGLDGVHRNGDAEHRLPGSLNVSFGGVPSDVLLGTIREVAVSTGSACTSASLEPSYVLRAMGVSDARARESVRFGLCRFTTEAEIDRAAELVVAKVKELRQGSPLWAEYLEGASHAGVGSVDQRR